MPKIYVKTLPLEPKVHVPDVIRRLGRALEDDIGFLPGQFVILWEYIPAGHFLYNGQIEDTQPRESHHPIVEITLLEGMSLSREQAIVKTLVREISRELNMKKSNICVSVTHLKSGKLFIFGDFKWTCQNKEQDLAM